METKKPKFREFPFIQDALEKKRGFGKCKRCGVLINFSDREIVKDHIIGKGCERVREIFGK